MVYIVYDIEYISHNVISKYIHNSFPTGAEMFYFIFVKWIKICVAWYFYLWVKWRQEQKREEGRGKKEEGRGPTPSTVKYVLFLRYIVFISFLLFAWLM